VNIAGGERAMRTARLVLRQLEFHDAPSVQAVYGDPETMVTMPWRLLPDEATAQAWVNDRVGERRDRVTPGTYLVTDHAGTLVGLCGFLPQGAQLEIGWAIRKPHWGRGYATEAAAAVLSRAGDRTVYAAVRPGNRESIRVAEKIGMRFDLETADEHGPLLVYVALAYARSGRVGSHGKEPRDA
jgi:RimJ/RimL family protein N-acetyltransferase